MPARSPGANPVRHTTANSGDVNQVTSLMPTGPRSCASTSAITEYRTRARPSMPRPCSRALRPIRASGTSTVTNASLRTAAPVNTAWSWLFACLASAGASGRRWFVSHSVRSAPSSGTVRTSSWISSTSSVRAAASRSWDSPAPNRSRSTPSAIPIPGWVTRAVTAQVRAVWCWMTATRVWVGPCGGPSCTSTADNTPGRSAASRSSTRPCDALLRQLLQRSVVPIRWRVAARNHPVADRPRTGTTTTTATSSQTPNAAKAAVHRPRCRQHEHRQGTEPEHDQLPAAETEHQPDPVPGVLPIHRHHQLSPSSS